MARTVDFEKRLLIGRKLAEARHLANLRQEDVMVEVFGAPLDSRNKNRISEIESGKTMPDAELLQVLCLLYGVSADWVLGFTVEPEIDKTQSIAGILFNGVNEMLREQVIAMTAQLSLACARHVVTFPKALTIELLEQSKLLIKTYMSLPNDVKEQLQPGVVGLMQCVRDCEHNRALQARNLEMAMDDLYNHDETEPQQKILADIIDSRKRFPMTTLNKKDEAKGAKVSELPQIGLFEEV